MAEDSSEVKLGFFDQFHVVLERMVVLKDIGRRRGIPTQENSSEGKGFFDLFHVVLVRTVVVVLKMGDVFNKDTSGDDIIDLAPPHTNCLVVEAWENTRRQCIKVLCCF